jgi:hypothetical protein
MNKCFALLLPALFTLTARAQTTPTLMPFGKIDNADQSDFDQDANSLFKR